VEGVPHPPFGITSLETGLRTSRWVVFDPSQRH
jgi:hypothetical protein